jgi:hypothetical protein
MANTIFPKPTWKDYSITSTPQPVWEEKQQQRWYSLEQQYLNSPELSLNFPESSLPASMTDASADAMQHPQLMRLQPSAITYHSRSGFPSAEAQHQHYASLSLWNAHNESANQLVSAWQDTVDMSWSQDDTMGWQPTPMGSYKCWQHGCAGRSFSSLSNYRRHLRERTAPRPKCPICGRKFVRTAAKNEHVREGRCTIIQLDANCMPIRAKIFT